MSSQDHDRQLPPELMEIVLANTPREDLTSAAQVSAFWHDNAVRSLYMREELEVTSGSVLMAFACTPRQRLEQRERDIQRIKLSAFEFGYSLLDLPLGEWVLIHIFKAQSFPNVRSICLKTGWHLNPEQPDNISSFRLVEQKAMEWIGPRTTELVLEDEVSFYNRIPRENQFLAFPPNNITTLKLVTQGTYYMAIDALGGLPNLKSFSWAENDMATLAKDVDCGLWTLFDGLAGYNELDLVDITGVLGEFPDPDVDVRLVNAKTVRLSSIAGSLVEPVLDVFNMLVMEELEVEPIYASRIPEVSWDPLTVAATDGESSLRKLRIERFFDDWSTNADPTELDGDVLVGIARGNPNLQYIKIGEPWGRFDSYAVDDDAIWWVARALPDLQEFILHVQPMRDEIVTMESARELQNRCSQLQRVSITQRWGDMGCDVRIGPIDEEY